jgi:hypothetical protein
MTQLATYVSSSEFYIDSERDQEFEVGRRIALSQGNSGISYVSVLSASYSPSVGRTYVIVTPDSVLSSLVSISRGPSSANSVGEHYHTGHGDGGPVSSASIGSAQATRLKAFADLTGTLGQVLQTDSDNALSYSHPILCLSLTAGEALSRYQVVYQDTTDSGKCKLAQQDGTSASAEVMGLVLDSVIADDASGNILRSGPVTNDSWSWTPGAILYLSGTAGEMTESKPQSNYIVRCGQAHTATMIYFNPIRIDS